MTGSAVGKELGVCEVCNYDFGWLLTHPSVLIWADSIVLTQSVWDVVQSEAYPEPKTAAKACRLVLDIAASYGITEVRDARGMFADRLAGTLLTQAEQDISQIRQAFPETVGIPIPENETDAVRDFLEKHAEDFLRIDGIHYCAPYVGSVYASLLLARAWDAGCLFDMKALNLLHHKFRLATCQEETEVKTVQSYRQVFDMCFANDPLFPSYVFASIGECKDCQRCNDSYLKDVESRVLQVLRWRDYDEVQQAKSAINSIIAKQTVTGEDNETAEVLGEFRALQLKLKRRMHAVFPQVKRWSNVATLVSLPIAVAGVATGSILAVVAGASVAALAKGSKELTELLESKYRWVGFCQELEDRRTEG